MKKLKFNKKGLLAPLSLSLVLGIAGLVMAATTVSLGTADDFAILGGSGITIGGAVNTSTITGDIGTFPTDTITGIGNAVLTGTNHAGDATTQSAKTALTTAYGDASQPATTVPTELGGTTKNAGVYDSADGTFGITGTLTLDGQGDANAVFIFRTTTTLTTAGASVVSLINGAQACNVFWQVGSSATLGSASFFKGNILALTDIGLGTTANVEGRVLARNGAVTLDGSNVVTKATCVAPLILSIPRATAPAIVAPVLTVPPLINVTKIPSPLALPAGPGSVTYAYAVTNIGIVPMHDVTINDNKCSAINFISGDVNNNSLLEVGEVWNYSCTKVVSQTETNTVTVRGIGSDNAWDAYDIASAIVVVGSPLPPPLIHIVKKPNTFVLPAVGGFVTYNYTVSNPGTAPLSDVSVIDDKCTGLPGRVVGHPGDINKNNLLESNEVWQFACQTFITKTTTNVATAQGHANGLTAIDFAQATVAVASPSLPNTGYGPENRNMWGIIAGVLIMLPIFYFIRKRQTV